MLLRIFKFNLGLIAIVFMTRAGISLWHYSTIDRAVPVTVHQWKIRKKSSGFAIQARYSFTVENKIFKGKTVFSKPYQLNRLSAENQIKKVSSQSWKAWHNPSHPEISSLERIFPWKTSLYSLMILGIFFYFVQLSRSL